jgi:long-chain acyl-CoA synthetase
MLSHGAILSNCQGAHDLLLRLGLSDEVFLSFLPLGHAYEHTAGQFFPLSIGAQIYYAEGLDQLAATLAEVRPTIMTAVPRLYEVLRHKILLGMERRGGASRAWFHRALALGLKRQHTPAAMTARERILDHLCSLLVRRAIGKRFGGRLKCFVSGGAPLAVEVGAFFTALGVRVLQGYGLTECGPVISVNPPDRIKMETVGPPLRGVDLTLAEDGEICVRGELVMRGYWNNPTATEAVIDADGWLHTGDLGTLDADGYLCITDRKKDIIVTSGGDTIAPQRVEGFLALEPEIAQAMVYGDRRPHLVALIVPDPDHMRRWAADHGRDPDLADIAADADFRTSIAETIRRVNRAMAPPEKVRRFCIAADPFSVDNGMMTPTMKIRRHVVREHYRDRLEGLYE